MILTVCAALALSIPLFNAVMNIRVNRALVNLDRTLAERNIQLARKSRELQKESLLVLEMSRLIRGLVQVALHPDPDATQHREKQIGMLNALEEAEKAVSASVYFYDEDANYLNDLL